MQIHADGSATVMSGTSAHGQGHATSFSMIVADRLGIPMEKITYVSPTPRWSARGGGTGGSRSLQLGGNAVGKAADERARARPSTVAARMLEADADGHRRSTDGGFGVAGVPGAGVGWPELAAVRRTSTTAASASTPTSPRTARRSRSAPTSRSSRSTPRPARSRPLRHVAVDDCGRILNPLIVAGQQHGGARPGHLARRCGRSCVYDEDGTPLTCDLRRLRHARPRPTRSRSRPPTPRRRRRSTRSAPRASASPRTIGSTPAVQNAVVDALKHLGVKPHRPALHRRSGSGARSSRRRRHRPDCGGSRRPRSTASRGDERPPTRSRSERHEPG